MTGALTDDRAPRNWIGVILANTFAPQRPHVHHFSVAAQLHLRTCKQGWGKKRKLPSYRGGISSHGLAYVGSNFKGASQGGHLILKHNFKFEVNIC